MRGLCHVTLVSGRATGLHQMRCEVRDVKLVAMLSVIPAGQ
jgi:hypothetical protein